MQEKYKFLFTEKNMSSYLCSLRKIWITYTYINSITFSYLHLIFTLNV